MALYEELRKLDLFSPILGKAKINFTPDGQPKIFLECHGEPTSPWMSYLKTRERKCHLWGGAYFKYYHIIPAGCRNCWKVVMSIPTLRQLMKINEWQKTCSYDCKCGFEALD